MKEYFAKLYGTRAGSLCGGGCADLEEYNSLSGPGGLHPLPKPALVLQYRPGLESYIEWWLVKNAGPSYSVGIHRRLATDARRPAMSGLYILLRRRPLHLFRGTCFHINPDRPRRHVPRDGGRGYGSLPVGCTSRSPNTIHDKGQGQPGQQKQQW